MGELQLEIIYFLRLQNSFMENLLSAKHLWISENVLDFKLIMFCFVFFIRFDAAAEQMRGAVLDNSFMGSNCTVEKQKRNFYRISANIERYEVKVRKT